MVSGFDMGTIQGLNQLGGSKGGSAGKSPMNGGKTLPPAPKDPNAPEDPNAVANPLAEGTTTEAGQAGATDLAGGSSGIGAGQAGSSGGGLGTMDKLNKVAKLFQGYA